jgi:hypothetical protein
VTDLPAPALGCDSCAARDAVIAGQAETIAATDPSARHLQTSGHDPAELSDRIAAMIPAVSIPA